MNILNKPFHFHCAIVIFIVLCVYRSLRIFKFLNILVQNVFLWLLFEFTIITLISCHLLAVIVQKYLTTELLTNKNLVFHIQNCIHLFDYFIKTIIDTDDDVN